MHLLDCCYDVAFLGLGCIIDNRQSYRPRIAYCFKILTYISAFLLKVQYFYGFSILFDNIITNLDSK